MNRIKLSATESTNSYLTGLMSTGVLADFTVVSAYEQTKGRGQLHAKWESEPGKNLTFSVLKKHSKFGAQDHFLISACVSLALYNVLSRMGVPRLRVKWPNDILSGTLKICGILIENTISGTEIRASVIGIGLNVNQISFQQQPKASSLKLILQREFHLELLLDTILEEFQIYLMQLEPRNWDELLRNYENVLFKKDVPAIFQEPNGPFFTGIIRGVKTEGKLILELEDETVKHYDLKEVKLHY